MTRAWLTLALSLLAVGCSCGDDCAGRACDACPPAIQIDVEAPTATDGPNVTGTIELTCDARPGGWLCYAISAPVGSYTFDVSLDGERRTVTIELREGGEGCCSCATVSAVGQVAFSRDGDAGSPDAGSTDAGSTDAASTDAGSTDAGWTDAAATDAATAQDGGAPADGGGPACDRSVVELPAGQRLEPGTLCDDVFACVPASAAATVEAATVFDCTGVVGVSCAAGERACAYADPGGPSTLDDTEVANVCALTVHSPPPSRVVCRVYL